MLVGAPESAAEGLLVRRIYIHASDRTVAISKAARRQHNTTAVKSLFLFSSGLTAFPCCYEEDKQTFPRESREFYCRRGDVLVCSTRRLNTERKRDD